MAIAALAIAVALAACGGSGNGDVTLTIGSRATPEEEVLGHVYAEALRQAGYKVEGDFGIELENETAPIGEIELENISGYPDHVDTVVRLLRPETEELPTDLRQGYEIARDKLGESGLTAFPPAPYSRNVQTALLRRTADRYELETVSDLKGKTDHMSVAGPTACHPSPYCLGGVEKQYGILFGGGYLYIGKLPGGDPYRALEKGELDVAFVTNTDGKLARAEKFALLEDDKQILPAGNPIFVTSKKVAEEAGEDYEKTIVAVQKDLDLPAVQRLVAEVELEGKKPAQVAARYVDGIELPD